MPVLRQNSMRTENSAISCRDGCPVQVIPSPSSAKNLSPRETQADRLASGNGYISHIFEPAFLDSITLKLFGVKHSPAA
jgi:hypothetical protein